jgi:hypothetical protein
VNNQPIKIYRLARVPLAHRLVILKLLVNPGYAECFFFDLLILAAALILISIFAAL